MQNKEIIAAVINYFIRPKTAFRLAYLLASAGVALLIQPFWEPVLKSLTQNYFDINIPDLSPWIPWALIGSGVAVFTLDRVIPLNQMSSEKPRIRMNYMRLFGAVEVPQVMAYLGKKFRLELMMDADVIQYYGDKRGNVPPMNNVFFEFWRKDWQYSNALPLETPHWKKYSGNRRIAKDLMWSAAHAAPSEVVSFAYWDEVNQSRSESREICEKVLGQDFPEPTELIYSSQDIGYLFLVLENTSQVTIENINVEFEIHRISNHLIAFNFDSALKPLAEWEEPEKRFPSVEKLSSFAAEKEVKKIAELRPNQSVICLLEIYRKDSEGLPAFFLDDVVRIKHVTAESSNGRLSLDVRKPFGAEAARVLVPFGWFCQ